MQEKAMSFQRVDKWLANLGYCTRQHVPKWLKQNKVEYLGERVLRADQKVPSHGLLVNGKPLDHPEGLLILLHKPAGYVCSHASSEGLSVYDLLPEQWRARHPQLESIGRLDKDTTGIILITDLTGKVHELTHPKKKVIKRYRVDYEGQLPQDAIERLAAGELQLVGESTPCRPAKLIPVEAGRALLEIEEGRYHQVKRMFGAMGLEVRQLHRESFGDWQLGDLACGNWLLLQDKGAKQSLK